MPAQAGAEAAFGSCRARRSSALLLLRALVDAVCRPPARPKVSRAVGGEAAGAQRSCACAVLAGSAAAGTPGARARKQLSGPGAATPAHQQVKLPTTVSAACRATRN